MKGSAHFADRVFLWLLVLIGGSYLLLIALMVIADLSHTSQLSLISAIQKPEIQHAIRLTLFASTLSAILSMYVAIPTGYGLSRIQFRGKGAVEAILDAPLVLPPLVIGLSLLILFHWPIAGTTLEVVLQRGFGWKVTYSATAIVLAQFTCCASIAIRMMKVAFDEIPERHEAVAMTLGANRFQAVVQIVLPQVWRGIITAGTMCWAKAIGEFGPILVFAGATRMKTEVLATSVFLELSTGDLSAAIAIACLMMGLSFLVLAVIRLAERKPA